jgi:drug/metabolite transporter (DMT)-like permease
VSCLLGVVTISWALLLIIMTMAGAFGGFFFKKATSFGLKISSHFILFLGIGGFFYLFSSILNIIVLKHMPYTVVFPLTAITYIWTLLISYFFLKESITGKKIAGVIFICIGAVFLVI